MTRAAALPGPGKPDNGSSHIPCLSQEHHQPAPATSTWQQRLLSALSKTAPWLPEPNKAIVLSLTYSLQVLGIRKGCWKVLMKENVSAQFKGQHTITSINAISLLGSGGRVTWLDEVAALGAIPQTLRGLSSCTL